MTVLPTTVWIVPPPGTFDDAGTSGMRKWARSATASRGADERRRVAPSLLDALPLLGEIALQIAVTRLDVRHRRAA